MDKSLLTYLKQQESSMIQDLYDFCAINSGTGHLEGLKIMRDRLIKAFEPLGGKITSLPSAKVPILQLSGQSTLHTFGDTLLVQKRPHLKRRVLLGGHMDTVYDAHHSFQSITQTHENQINGPGVADMKGGLVVMLYALKAFETTPIAKQLGIDVFINADEEVGSPASGQLFTQMSDYIAGLIYEPSMTPEGMLAKHRKGSGKFTVIATGKSAHAGRSFDEGRNAICHLAKAITQIDALNHKRSSITINVGQISGGEALNVVPAIAVAKLDVRITNPEDDVWFKDRMSDILSNMRSDGFTLSLQGDFGRPIKHVNQNTERLFHQLQQIGKTIGLQLDWKDSGGCCDGNNLAVHGYPVLDTLGVRGGKIHSPEEFVFIDSLVERALLSALLLVELAS